MIITDSEEKIIVVLVLTCFLLFPSSVLHFGACYLYVYIVTNIDICKYIHMSIPLSTYLSIIYVSYTMWCLDI